MAKLSRPILYAAILGAVAYAAVVLTEPQAPPKKKAAPRTTRTATTTTDNGSNITPEDLTAQFTRYEPQKKAHDPFVPRVVTAHALAAASAAAGGPGGALAAGRGSWVLTGIAAIDGNKSALLENGSTGESVFLKAGDKWNGLRVAAVGAQSVAFMNAQGQRTELGFPELDDQPQPGGSPSPGGTGTGAPAGPAGAFPSPNNGAAPPARLAVGQPGGTNGS